MKAGLLVILGGLSALIFASIAPRPGAAQDWHQEDCANLAIQFDPGGVLSAFGTDCRQLKSPKGRLEMLSARAVQSMYVTSLYHIESLNSDPVPSVIEDFVTASSMFTRTSTWSQPVSMNGYQVKKFRGQLRIDPFWDAHCIAFSRYVGGSGDKFRHQISGFSCVDPTVAGDGMTNAETEDLLSRIRTTF